MPRTAGFTRPVVDSTMPHTEDDPLDFLSECGITQHIAERRARLLSQFREAISSVMLDNSKQRQTCRELIGCCAKNRRECWRLLKEHEDRLVRSDLAREVNGASSPRPRIGWRRRSA